MQIHPKPSWPGSTRSGSLSTIIVPLAGWFPINLPYTSRHTGHAFFTLKACSRQERQNEWPHFSRAVFSTMSPMQIEQVLLSSAPLWVCVLESVSFLWVASWSMAQASSSADFLNLCCCLWEHRGWGGGGWSRLPSPFGWTTPTQGTRALFLLGQPSCLLISLRAQRHKSMKAFRVSLEMGPSITPAALLKPCTGWSLTAQQPPLSPRLTIPALIPCLCWKSMSQGRPAAAR